jgi:hypothetical protein
VIDGQEGWFVCWVDYRQAPWRQCAFVAHEAEARELVKSVRASVRNDSE